MGLPRLSWALGARNMWGQLRKEGIHGRRLGQNAVAIGLGFVPGLGACWLEVKREDKPC